MEVVNMALVMVVVMIAVVIMGLAQHQIIIPNRPCHHRSPVRGGLPTI